jgi:preprotein translocase subunit SecA
MFKRVIRAIFGDPNERELKRYRPIVDEISALEPVMKAQ